MLLVYFNNFMSKMRQSIKTLTLVTVAFFVIQFRFLAHADAGGLTHGGANSYEVDGNIVLYDRYAMMGTTPFNIKKEKLWPHLQEMFDYLDG